MMSPRATGWALASVLTALLCMLIGLPGIARAEAPEQGRRADAAPVRTVLVARRAIRPGQAVSSAAVELRELDARRVPRDALSDAAGLRGLRARRAVAPGSVLRASGLEAVTDVQRGQRVKLVVRSAGLRIESYGRAREDGNVGDWVEAQNWSSRRTVMGRVGSDGALHVQP